MVPSGADIVIQNRSKTSARTIRDVVNNYIFAAECAS